MKKVLIHSNHSKALTGFGKHTKNLLIYLFKTGKYELVEFANGKKWSDPDLAKLPWKAYGSIPDNDELVAKLSKDPSSQRSVSYGAYLIDKVIAKENPDVYIGIEDIWAFSKYWDKPWWNKLSHAIWTTLDSLPILPEAIKAAPKIKNYFVWASFAEKAMKKEGHDHVRMIRGSLDTNTFYKIEPSKRERLRQAHGISKDEFIIGFVFRNQLRKSVPNLLDGFKNFLDKNPGSKAKLLLHTHWGEGWDIPRLLKEKNIDNKSVLTTYYCNHCKNYQIKPFEGQEKTCPFCGKEKGQNTTNVRSGVSEDQLNEVYNLMDVYCHPFTSGGQEIPVQEAKLTELITLVTNYSCGEDTCTDESGGLPLNWKEYREPGTQFIKATTDPSHISTQLSKVFKMKPEKLKEKGERARQFVLDNFSIEVIGKQIDDFIEAQPKAQYEFEDKQIERNPSFEADLNLDNENFVLSLYENVLKRTEDLLNEGPQHWLSKLKSGTTKTQVADYFKSVAAEENKKFLKSVSELVDDTDQGKRIALIVEENATEVFYATALLPSIKRLYKDSSIYFFAKPELLDIVAGNPHINKCIPLCEEALDCLNLEGNINKEKIFEIAYYPSSVSSGNFKYCHRNKDIIEYETKCTS